MRPTLAAHLISLARKAVRNGLLTHHQFVALECLIWEIRERGADRVQCSYKRLMKQAKVCKDVAVGAIKAGIALGLLRKVKHKTLTLWTNGGRKWQQEPNEYVFCCESAEQAQYPKQVIKILSIIPAEAEIRSAQAAMEARARVIQAGLLNKGAALPSG